MLSPNTFWKIWRKCQQWSWFSENFGTAAYDVTKNELYYIFRTKKDTNFSEQIFVKTSLDGSFDGMLMSGSFQRKNINRCKDIRDIKIQGNRLKHLVLQVKEW